MYPYEGPCSTSVNLAFNTPNAACSTDVSTCMRKHLLKHASLSSTIVFGLAQTQTVVGPTDTGAFSSSDATTDAISSKMARNLLNSLGAHDAQSSRNATIPCTSDEDPHTRPGTCTGMSSADSRADIAKNALSRAWPR